VAIVVSAAIETSQAEAGARRFNGALASMRSGVSQSGQALAGLGVALRNLPSILAAAGLAKLGKEAVETGDKFLQLKARLELTARDGATASGLLVGLGEAAERARVPVAELAAVYAKNANAFQDMKLSQADGIRVIETLVKSIKLSGATAAETASVMGQLGQALGANRLQGEEFNAVAESAPDLLRAMTRETGKTRGELKKLGEEGKIAGTTITQTLLNISRETDQKFARMPKTAGEAFAALNDTVSQSFAKAAETAGVSKAWAELFDSLREGAGGSATKAAFATFAEGLASIGRGLKDLKPKIEENRLALMDWVAAFKETSVYKGFLDFLGEVRVVMGAGLSVAGDAAGAFGAIANAIVGIKPAEDRLRGFADSANGAKAALQGLQAAAGGGTDEKGVVRASDPERKKVEFGKPDTTEEIKKLKQLIATEQLQYQLKKSAAEDVNGIDSDRTVSLRAQLEIQGKITKEMRDASPALARRLEAEIRASAELERQQAIYEKNRELGERFAQGISDAFRSAAESGKSFGASLRQVLGRLVDMTTQALILEPLVKSIGRSFAGQVGGTDVGGSIFSSFMGSLGLGGAGGGAGIGGWSTTTIPAFANGGVVDGMTPFAHRGGLGVMGEAGPEAIMPLRRGPDGKLGVAAAGAGGGANITFHVQGNPDQSALAQMERMARQIVAEAAPGIVSTSVRQVASRHRDDPKYLRR
jgi:tape measure domain-containing protein